MNHFELFKLKAAGLTNLNILNILDYQETQDRKLSLRDMAVVSKSKNAVLFIVLNFYYFIKVNMRIMI